MGPEHVPFLLELADDELLLGHRHSEWTAFAPTIEEDVALASIAQDEMAHARLILEVAERLGAGSVDRNAFWRPAPERRNARLVELPNRDWAFAIARHVLYDLADDVRTEALTQSRAKELADWARLVRREERYHLEHGEAWLKLLSEGTEESRQRLLGALGEVVGELGGVLTSAHEDALVAEGIWPVGSAELSARLAERLSELSRRVGCELVLVPSQGPDAGRLGRHSAHLDELLDTMAAVVRLDPAASW